MGSRSKILTVVNHEMSRSDRRAIGSNPHSISSLQQLALFSSDLLVYHRRVALCSVSWATFPLNDLLQTQKSDILLCFTCTRRVDHRKDANIPQLGKSVDHSTTIRFRVHLEYERVGEKKLLTEEDHSIVLINGCFRYFNQTDLSQGLKMLKVCLSVRPSSINSVIRMLESSKSESEVFLFRNLFDRWENNENQVSPATVFWEMSTT